MDAQRRAKLLGDSGLGKAILAEEAERTRLAGHEPVIPPERRRLLQTSAVGRWVLREHDKDAGRDPVTGRSVSGS